MNLLIDQEDQQKPQPIEEPQETPKVFAQPQAEEPPTPLPLDTPEDYYRYDRVYAKKRNLLGPVVIIVFLVSIIAAAAYFSFFYKGNEFPGYTPFTEKVTVGIDTARAAPQTTETPKDTAITQKPVVKRAMPAPALVNPLPAGGHPLENAARLLMEITGAATEQVNIGTVIVDDNSFSAEISSRSRSAIETYFAGLKSKIGGELSFSPASGNNSGVRALLTGNFRSGSQEAGPATADGAGIEKKIQQLAVEKGMKVLEISRAKTRISGNVKHSPLFVKVAGEVNSFPALCSAIAGMAPDIVFSKIIVMFSSRQQATFVLRLELVERT